MSLSIFLLPAALAFVPDDEPVWIGIEAIRTVKLNDPNVAPRSQSPGRRLQRMGL
jgi:hypothetical protein